MTERHDNAMVRIKLRCATSRAKFRTPGEIKAAQDDKRDRERVARRERARRARAAMKGTKMGNHVVLAVSAPPPEVLAARDAGYLAPRTLTAEFCGDPLPGRSALDARGGRV